jgi:hypothetical protein
VDRFIVGTGRCGSTLLSRMIGQHPAVLSVFEFFTGLDMTKRFSHEPVTGEALAALISQEHPFVTMVVRRGHKVEEITYPFDSPSARYRRDDALPWVLVSALPRLTDDPDALFDETLAFARTLPRQHLTLHYRALFEWLANRLGKTCWIERSGSSIDYLASLREFFPQGRFLHIHRDGHEAALSMREHAAYRLAISLLYQLPADETPAIADLRGIDVEGTAEDDPVSRMLASRPPVEYFGRYWSQELLHGFRALAQLDAIQYAEVRFEELVTKPRETMRTIAEFFELPADGAWVDDAAALVRGVPPTRFDTLPADERERLAEACRPGMTLLGRA